MFVVFTAMALAKLPCFIIAVYDNGNTNSIFVLRIDNYYWPWLTKIL